MKIDLEKSRDVITAGVMNLTLAFIFYDGQLKDTSDEFGVNDISLESDI